MFVGNQRNLRISQGLFWAVVGNKGGVSPPGYVEFLSTLFVFEFDGFFSNILMIKVQKC